MLLDVLKDAVLDTAKMLPFLFVAYLLIEYVEHRHSKRIEDALAGGGRFGFVPGAMLGLLPQCGFSAMAASLYSSRAITLGTLLAVFLSTSDEAIPIMLSMPGQLGNLAVLLTAKLVVALIAGFCIDFIFKKSIPASVRGGYTGADTVVDCHEHVESDGIFVATIKHTVAIGAFVFVFNFALGLIVTMLGSEVVAGFVSGWGFLQPVVAGLIGLVPNCAASVLLTQLYAAGTLNFGGVLAGLCTGAGVGLTVLLRANKSLKQNLFIIGLLYFIGVAAGLLVQLFIG
ncbi:MAG: putative manganese transporter [Oscillospiraceae bacterium]